jgi:hypothetical protein
MLEKKRDVEPIDLNNLRHLHKAIGSKAFATHVMGILIEEGPKQALALIAVLLGMAAFNMRKNKESPDPEVDEAATLIMHFLHGANFEHYAQSAVTALIMAVKSISEVAHMGNKGLATALLRLGYIDNVDLEEIEVSSPKGGGQPN